MYTSVYIYPWDIFDEGIKESLAQIREIGINCISVAVSYHTGRFLLPHNPVAKVYYHQGGTVYFKPCYQHYGKMVPKTGKAYENYRANISQYRNEDLLSEIISAAKNNGIGVRAWVVGCHNSRLGHIFPDCTIRNVFGDRYYHALCPNQPETRRYILQMIDDLVSGYGLDGIELESYEFMGFLHGDHHEKIGMPCLNMLESTMGLCFCEECEKRGNALGIDVYRLKTALSEYIRDVFEMKAPSDCSNMEGLDEYKSMRMLVVEEIYAEIKKIIDRSGKNTSIYGILLVEDNGVEPGFYGTNPQRLNRYVDGWISAYPGSEEDVSSFVARARAAVPDAKKLIGGLRLMPPQLKDIDRIGRYIDNYRKSGIDGISFYNYGLVPMPVLLKLKEYL